MKVTPSKVVAGSLAAVAAAAMLLPAFPAWAQGPATADGAPIVAHVSNVTDGPLVITHADGKTESEAIVNDPVLVGDFLSTSTQSARAEVQLDGYTALRLGADAQARLAANDAKARQIQLAQGTIDLSIVHADPGTTEIVTPSVTVSLLQTGDYRVSVDANAATSVTVRSGRADVIAGKQTIDLAPGKTLLARGDAANPTTQLVAELRNDAFDGYDVQRDRAMTVALSDDSHVPATIATAADLSRYGYWANVAPYGQVWVPYDQGANWAPYRSGQWAWENGYGWTWIADEPWGWAPFHYGNWFYQTGYGWCWFPPLGAYPVWAPAMVGFFGYGIGSFGFGNFGWVALAPYEPYYPWYPYYGYVPPVYIYVTPSPKPPRKHRPIRRRHPMAIAYRNAKRGATAVSVAQWRGGDFRHPVAVDPRRISHVTLVRGTLPLKPTAANMRLSSLPLPRPLQLASAWQAPRFRVPKANAARIAATPKAHDWWQQFDRARGAAVHEPARQPEIRSHVPSLPALEKKWAAEHLPAVHVPTVQPMSRSAIGSHAIVAPMPQLHAAPVERVPVERVSVPQAPEHGGTSSRPSRPPA